MNYMDYYQYSWFANLAYIEWSIANTSNKDAMIVSAT